MVTDKNFSYQTVRAESVFQLLRRYVFSVLCNDQVFLSSGKINKTFLVYIAQISGLQPAVFQGLGCLFRHFIVSLHNAAALYPQFSVYSLCLTVGHQLSHGILPDVPLL